MQTDICSVVIWQKRDSRQLPVFISPADKQSARWRNYPFFYFYLGVTCSEAANAASARGPGRRRAAGVIIARQIGQFPHQL